MLLKSKSAVWGSMDKKSTTSTTSSKSSSKSKKSKTLIRENSIALLKIDKTTPLSAAEISTQVAYGAQSQRPSKGKYLAFGYSIDGDAHGTYCFKKMVENEQRLCGEYAVFYHSYSFAALLYEVQAAVAAVLFRFKSNFASLPRVCLVFLCRFCYLFILFDSKTKKKKSC